MLPFTRYIHIRLLNVRQRLTPEQGQGLVEYSLILALISVVAVVVLTAIGTNVDTVLGKVRDALVKPAS